MRLHPEETEAGPWRRVGDAELAALVAPLLADGRGVLLVDGRSGSGKSTIAGRLADLLGGAVVHSDDLAWHHDAFAWDDLARDHVIEPWRRGEAVDYRPPGWVARGREGSVTVPADQATTPQVCIEVAIVRVDRRVSAEPAQGCTP